MTEASPELDLGQSLASLGGVTNEESASNSKSLLLGQWQVQRHHGLRISSSDNHFPGFDLKFLTRY